MSNSLQDSGASSVSTTRSGLATPPLKLKGLFEILEAVTESLPDGVVITDSSGRIIYVNESVQRFTGYASSELIGKNPGLLNADPNAEFIQQEILTFMKQGHTWRGKIRQKRKDGSTYPADFVIFPASDRGGSTLAWVSVQRDVTEHQDTVDDLKQRNEMLALLAKSAHQYLDMPCATVNYDLFTEHVLRLTQAEIVVINTFHKEAGQNVTESCATRSEKGLNKFISLLGFNPVGKTWPVNKQASALYTNRIMLFDGIYDLADGHLPLTRCRLVEKEFNIGGIYVIGLIHRNELLGSIDIMLPRGRTLEQKGAVEILANQIAATILRKRAEQSLWDSRQRYRSLIDHSRDAVFVTCPEGRYIEVNPAACRMLSYDREELLQMRIEDVVIPEYAGVTRRLFGLLVKEGSFFGEIALCTKSGDYLPAEINASVLPDGNYLGIVRDITERKRVEEDLQHTIVELQQTRNCMRNREKMAIVGQMAAGMAHEIRNPLTGVRGFAQLLIEKSGGNESLAGYARMILEETDRANKVIGDFLQLARPKQPALQNESLDDLLKEVLVIMQPQAFLRGIDVEYRAADHPHSLIDRDQIKQVLFNICQNAFQAMPNGGQLNIETGLIPATNEVYIDISDTGCGIAPDSLEKIGVPFYTTKDEGTGLGLSISYAIIDTHQGRIEAESTEGRGTRFRICLPASR